MTYRRHIPQVVSSLLEENLVMVAGGAVRSLFTNEKPADVDLFFYRAEDVGRARDALENDEYVCVWACPTVALYTYKKGSECPVQLICERYYATPEELIDTFDIVPGCAALVTVDLDDPNDAVVAHPLFLRTVAEKTILFHRITYPASTLRRIGKYQAKGYRLPAAAAQFYVNAVRALQPGAEDWLRVYID